MTSSSLPFKPVIAGEIEFYLHGSSALDTEPFWRDLRQACAAEKIDLYHIEKERGHEQYEVALMPAAPQQAIHQLVWLKSWLSEQAGNHRLKADFSAKPFTHQPGSGLHIHLHLEDEQGRNVFFKHDALMSEPLRWSIGGLLARLPHDMPIFAPHPESYLRFEHAGEHTPTTISWGANNRTCAIRLPDSKTHEKHLEHRVAGADADPVRVIEAVLAGVCYGLVERVEPPAQIYGRAGDSIYALPRLPLSLEEARKLSVSSPLPAN